MPRLRPRGFRPSAQAPWIVVPLTGADDDALLASAVALTGRPVDAVEWRVDLHPQAAAEAGAGRTPAVLERLRAALDDALPGAPVLATVRTRAEGGLGAEDTYPAAVQALAASGLVDAVDVEYRRPGAARLVEAAHAAGVEVVASAHDFDRTPPAAEIVEHLSAMEALGADVAKIAVTPGDAADVLALLTATEQRARTAGVPVVTISMGALGAASRLCGGVFGSAATFATAGDASAPGQLPVEAVRSALDALGSVPGPLPTRHG